MRLEDVELYPDAMEKELQVELAYHSVCFSADAGPAASIASNAAPNTVTSA
jgi:hypothetical protein